MPVVVRLHSLMEPSRGTASISALYQHRSRFSAYCEMWSSVICSCAAYQAPELAEFQIWGVSAPNNKSS